MTRLAIRHTTQYRFADPPRQGLQRLRLTPRSGAGQAVLTWSVTLDGGAVAVAYEDHNLNLTTLASFTPGARAITITAEGLVATQDIAGMIGRHTGFMPLATLLAPTPLTRPGPRLARLAARFRHAHDDAIALLHELSAAIHASVSFEVGRTDAQTTAEAALTSGHGVCQDHAHIFIAAARLLEFPARYVSGYLLIPEQTNQTAGHGWAEAYIAGLGWVGFDVANAISPDARYVRLAVGADYRDAAPITGLVVGGGASELAVTVAVTEIEAVDPPAPHPQQAQTS